MSSGARLGLNPSIESEFSERSNGSSAFFVTPIFARRSPNTPHTTAISTTKMANSTFSCRGDVYARHAKNLLQYRKDGTGSSPTTGSTARPFCIGGEGSSPSQRALAISYGTLLHERAGRLVNLK